APRRRDRQREIPARSATRVAEAIDDDVVGLARRHGRRHPRPAAQVVLVGTPTARGAAGRVVVAGDLRATVAGAAPHVEDGVEVRLAAARLDDRGSGHGRRPLEDRFRCEARLEDATVEVAVARGRTGERTAARRHDRGRVARVLTEKGARHARWRYANLSL